MFLDLFDRWLTPCPLHLREMGYLRELFGIRRRWRQWGWAWRSHCENTRRVILAASGRCTRRRKAVVFGSGFLHDVPLRDLSAAFAKVVLVDLIHPQSVRRTVRRYPNVELLAADVTGAAEGVWKAVERPGTPLPVSDLSLFLGDDEVDLVASVNLLSQLSCMPERYLRMYPVADEQGVRAFCQSLIIAHLRYLQSFTAVACLIADVEARTLTQAGGLVKSRGTLWGVEFPFAGERWVWSLVPRSPAPPHHAEHLIVAGVEDVDAAAGR